MSAHVQDALFGDPVPVEDAKTPPKIATQDVELIAAVVRLAQDPGYRLIERTGRVLRTVPGQPGAVEDVPRYEADTVLQLVDAGLVHLGGNHTVTYGGHSGPSRSVLVPRDTRNLVARWSNLRPLHTRTSPNTERSAEPPAEPTSGVITVTMTRPGQARVTCDQFHGEITRVRHRYHVATAAGHDVGRAASYQAGAELLARHHGYRPGRVVRLSTGGNR